MACKAHVRFLGSRPKLVDENGWRKCPYSVLSHRVPIFNGETIETHHQVPFKDGGSDEVSNLIHLHITCHQQVHGRKPKRLS